MRWLALILALLGGGACAAVGFIWKGEFDKLSAIGTVPSEAWNVVYALLGALPLGLIAGVFAFMRKRGVALLLLVVCIVAPAVFGYLAQEKRNERNVDKNNDILMFAAGAASPFLLSALIVILMKGPPREKKKSRDEETPAFNDEEEQVEQREDELLEDEVVEEPPPPAPPATPIAKIKCPKCVTVLKIPNPQSIKPIKCPKCQAAFRIPPALVEKAQNEAKAAAPPRQQRPPR